MKNKQKLFAKVFTKSNVFNSNNKFVEVIEISGKRITCWVDDDLMGYKVDFNLCEIIEFKYYNFFK